MFPHIGYIAGAENEWLQLAGWPARVGVAGVVPGFFLASRYTSLGVAGIFAFASKSGGYPCELPYWAVATAALLQPLI